MAETTIPVSRDVKNRLEEEKRPNESWNATLLRLAGDGEFTEWSEEEIRSIARQEAEDVLRQYR